MSQSPTEPTEGGAPPAGEERRRDSLETRARRAQELVHLVADIAARIRTVCAHLPDDEFEQLAVDMARMQLRFNELDRRYSR